MLEGFGGMCSTVVDWCVIMLQVVIVVAGHFMGDYGLQNNWMAVNKGKNWYVLVAHAFVYSLTVWLCMEFASINVTLGGMLYLIGSHIVIDKVKCMGYTNEVGDQVCHYLVLLTVVCISVV